MKLRSTSLASATLTSQTVDELKANGYSLLGEDRIFAISYGGVITFLPTLLTLTVLLHQTDPGRFTRSP